MTQLEGCVFCNPTVLNERLINENDIMCSFLANPRLTEGHSLVIPKRHVELPTDLTTEEITGIFQEVQHLQTILLSGLAKGIDVFQKTRPFVEEGHHGTKVDHIHFHVIPSDPGSELYEEGLMWGAGSHRPLSRLEESAILPVLRGVV